MGAIATRETMLPPLLSWVEGGTNHSARLLHPAFLRFLTKLRVSVLPDRITLRPSTPLRTAQDDAL
jgi:hypothetical protein